MPLKLFRIFIFLLAVMPLYGYAQNKQPESKIPETNKKFKFDWSDALFISGRAFDIGSGFAAKNSHEANPLLGRGRYTAKQAIISAGLSGAGYGLLTWGEIKYPEHRKRFKWVKRITGFASFGVGVWNLTRK